jgi:hypothetical protein
MELAANMIRVTPGKCCNTVERLGLVWEATPNFGPKVAKLDGRVVAVADECWGGSSSYFLDQQLAK